MSTSSNHTKAFVQCCHGKHMVASSRTLLYNHVRILPFLPALTACSPVGGHQCRFHRKVWAAQSSECWYPPTKLLHSCLSSLKRQYGLGPLPAISLLHQRAELPPRYTGRLWALYPDTSSHRHISSLESLIHTHVIYDVCFQ